MARFTVSFNKEANLILEQVQTLKTAEIERLQKIRNQKISDPSDTIIVNNLYAKNYEQLYYLYDLKQERNIENPVQNNTMFDF